MQWSKDSLFNTTGHLYGEKNRKKTQTLYPSQNLSQMDHRLESKIKIS